MKRFSLFILLFTGLFLISVNAQNQLSMYTYKQMGNRYVVSINNHEEIAKALVSFCHEMKIESGIISGIGAINELTLRFFNPDTKRYEEKAFHEQMEIANLTGNISTLDGKAYLHLHVTVGRRDCSALAGHLLTATLSGAGEFVVEDYGVQVSRVYNPDLGLNVYDFEK